MLQSSPTRSTLGVQDDPAQLRDLPIAAGPNERIRTNREENVSTKRTAPLEAPWLPPAHVDQSWSAGASEPSSPRPRKTISLIAPLRSRASFASLSTQGRRGQGKWCWVRHAPLPEPDGVAAGARVPQVGYAIGKKIGNAVVRNRIRRRLRPLVVAQAADLAPAAYLIGVKSNEVAWISHEELQNDLQRVLAAASEARRVL